MGVSTNVCRWTSLKARFSDDYAPGLVFFADARAVRQDCQKRTSTFLPS
jgi:hypothetical protein